MDSLFTVRVAAVVIIALIYMLFDLFNKRNVPSLFAYATLGFGIVFTILYFNTATIAISFLIAAAVGALGYLVYRAGQLGGADVIEFAALSMIIPIQQTPYLYNYFQYNLPFIISIFIATGVAALAMIPVYYLPRARTVLKKDIISYVTRRELVKGAALAVAYLAFLLFLLLETNITYIAIALVAIVMVGSILTITFEKPITDSMVESIPASKFEEGDMIALNLMSAKEIKEMKGRVRGFDRLVTGGIIKEMRSEKITRRFPVYRKAMPLALPIFIGVVASLLFGNLLLLIL